MLVAVVDAHFRARGEAFFLAAQEGFLGDLPGIGDAPQPVVPAIHTVVAHVELGVNAAFRQRIQQLVSNELAVGINGGDADTACQQRIHDLHEILADEGFAAGEGNLHHAAVDQLLHDGHDLRMGKLTKLRVRRGHVAVLAAVVAVPGDGPVRRTDIAGRIELVLLLRRNGIAALAGRDDAILFDLWDHVADLLGNQRHGKVNLSIAQLQRAHFLGSDKDGLPSALVHQRIGQLLPTTQEVIFLQLVKHLIILYTSLYFGVYLRYSQAGPSVPLP